MDNSNEVVMLVDKKSVMPPESNKAARNSIRPLLEEAGLMNPGDTLDRASNEFRGRDFVIRGLKGPEAIAAEYRWLRSKAVLLFLGEDQLAEFMCKPINGSRRLRNIVRLLETNIAPCRLRFLTRPDQPFNGTLNECLGGRRVYTKYPEILQQMLEMFGKDVNWITETTNADTILTRATDRSCAFEIVQSGRTAREDMGLNIVEMLDYYRGPVGCIQNDTMQIATNLFVRNPENLKGLTRRRVQEIGLALESALESRTNIRFTFQVPVAIKERFLNLGLEGPTESNVVTIGDNKIVSLQIVVPEEKEQSIRCELLRLGACDLCEDRVKVRRSSRDSEVLSVLPF